MLQHILIAHAERRDTWRFHANEEIKDEIKIGQGTVIPEPEVLRTMLLAGAGIGLLPDFHAAAAIEAGFLTRILPQYTCGSVDAHALYPSHRSLSAKVRVFIDSLVAYLSKQLD